MTNETRAQAGRDNVSTELREGLRRYDERIAELGGYRFDCASRSPRSQVSARASCRRSSRFGQNTTHEGNHHDRTIRPVSQAGATAITPTERDASS